MRNGSIRRTLPQNTPTPLCRGVDRRLDPGRRRSRVETKTAGPGEHTSEPPRFRRSVAQPGPERKKEEDEA
ncbi:hypothetical protein NDU88_010970 [Pleurodeles waltl]|uniref:Uncharacterized protein n=1 Tax=Pleurodeles waltl TaxID=8319 RepID=A0AAV7S0U6_PLEWA|nr:hypothetical protein NDU88_010970 [Pleurodeles waltl]